MSAFLIGENVNRYGNRQRNYLEQKEKIVGESASYFLRTIKDQKNLNALFFDTIAFLGTKRQEIAKAHQTKNAHLFGVRRDTPEGFQSPVLWTSLVANYSSSGEKMLKQIQDRLSRMKHSNYSFSEKKKSENFSSCLGRSFAIDTHVFSEKNSDYLISNTKDKENTIYQLGEHRFLDERELLELVRDFKSMKKLREEDFNFYQRLKGTVAVLVINQMDEGSIPKSDWIETIAKLEVDGKMQKISQYVTWCFYDRKTDPVKSMGNSSEVTIIHQDPFLIEGMLEDIAKLFEKAMIWKKDVDPVQALHETMALLDYEWAHTMPFARGSAAIGEWLQEAIYTYHGLNPKDFPSLNLEALILPLPDFIKLRLEGVEHK